MVFLLSRIPLNFVNLKKYILGDLKLLPILEENNNRIYQHILSYIDSNIFLSRADNQYLN